MISISKIREQRRQFVIDTLSADVSRLKESGRLEFALLIGSYHTGTFDGMSDVDIVCVVRGRKESSLCSRDFSISEQKDIDIILIDQSDWAASASWVKEGVAL
ncbi:nucleotidyltransferase domain-containing protein [Ferrovum sp.]|uniref:nucleotidyltransferase domain-containing protein n=1 Tax=Ferrovum sp. TaxID=2609467 RepID=UPI002632211E|nr:nucleotidyltransferase domain-containing protein [Ferrovum sp.]